MAARGDIRRSGRFTANAGDVAPAALAAVLFLLTPLPSRAEVLYSERVENFEIGVRDGTPEDIWTAIRRYGPFVQGQHAVGSAAGQLKWSDLSIARRGHDCRLESHAVSVSVVMTLPEWWRARSAPDDQLAYWRCIERTVTIHENRHAEIWRETAHAIDRALGRLDDWMPCDELRAAIGATANRLYQEGVARQRAFDDADRRRPRYQQCPMPAIAPGAIAVPRPKPIPTATTLANGHLQIQSPARGTGATDAKSGASPTTTANLGGRDADPNAESLAERSPFDELGSAAAAILAILAAVAGYAAAMAAVMALANRRTRSSARPEAD